MARRGRRNKSTQLIRRDVVSRRSRLLGKKVSILSDSLRKALRLPPGPALKPDRIRRRYLALTHSPNVNLKKNSSASRFKVPAIGRAIKIGAPQRAPLKKKSVCDRRSERKQVLHAIRKTGSGKGTRKKPVLTKQSLIRCK